ncbi:hypothetical protein CROQUDRAFT_47822 [Cronartium quercuum f. sp. fusiforme G11]|uniref:Uncharacterized protein n=1 Tax=Cronartium quercuum f. sp. fusiforme G11 TaxID=708437 RepID=A0A9P6NCB7_9BASI|nr:hypothetical protein CROQUDRAFT_47822 [Cronartium quercuum f. sp. fusiforme G11]
MQDQVPISIIPQDSDSDSGSEPHSEIPTPLPPLTLSLFRHLFDPRLSWSRKLSCVAATMAINLMLPFINGVMLGFGEIAARELVGRYLGWGPLGELYRKPKEEIKGSLMSGSTLSVVPNSSRWWEPANQGLIQRT